jgi:hypothetical protein
MQEINQSGGYNDEIEGKLKGILDSFKAIPGLGCFEGIEDAFQLAFDFVVIATGLVNLLHQRLWFCSQQNVVIWLM